MGKGRIRFLCQHYQRTLQNRKNHFKAFGSSLQRTQLQIQNGDLSAMSQAAYFGRRLQDVTGERIRGQQARCRAEWLERGKTSQKYCAAFERSKGEKGYIVELTDDSGTIRSKEGLLRATHFYSDPYRNCGIDDDACYQLLSPIDRRLSMRDKDACKGLYLIQY